MHEFPELPPPLEQPIDRECPSRQESPCHPHLPYVVDIRTLQEAVSKDANYVFDAIVSIMGELSRVRAENESTKQELETVKENWMDMNAQLIAVDRQLVDTQEQLATTQTDLKAALDDFSQRRLDWYNRSQRYEELMAIGSAKQVVLWKFIERIQNGNKPKQEGTLDVAAPPLIGTHITPAPASFLSPRIEDPTSTITEFKGSPEKGTFNPNAVSYAYCFEPGRI